MPARNFTLSLPHEPPRPLDPRTFSPCAAFNPRLPAHVYLTLDTGAVTPDSRVLQPPDGNVARYQVAKTLDILLLDPLKRLAEIGRFQTAHRRKKVLMPDRAAGINGLAVAYQFEMRGPFHRAQQEPPAGIARWR
jgi:hypothetical protein